MCIYIYIRDSQTIPRFCPLFCKITGLHTQRLHKNSAPTNASPSLESLCRWAYWCEPTGFGYRQLQVEGILWAGSDAIDSSDFGGILKRNVCKMDANTFNSLLIPFRIVFGCFWTLHVMQQVVESHICKNHYMMYIYIYVYTWLTLYFCRYVQYLWQWMILPSTNRIGFSFFSFSVALLGGKHQSSTLQTRGFHGRLQNFEHPTHWVGFHFY